MMGTNDFLVNMDYLALSMFQNVRQELLESEHNLECMQLFMRQDMMSKAAPLIAISERIKKVMLDY